MVYYADDDPMVELIHIRENMLQEHGGWEGMLKFFHEDEERMKQEGWHFETPEEFEARTGQRRAVVA
jgi:hypothetical protein